MVNRIFSSPRNIILASTIIGLIAVAGFAGNFVLSTKAEVGEINVTEDKIAIRGYDTVAYFTEGKAMKGDSRYEHVWQGARWHFVSAANRDLFTANPDHYAPRYGGYCSMGLAMGEFSDADPEVWSIVDGKLYLNKAEWVQDLWRKAPDAYIVTSEANWNRHRQELRVNENLR